jgi:endo-1,4-beta-mannosidase
MYQEPIDKVGQLIDNLKSMPTLSNAHVTIYIKDSEANNTHVKQKTGADYVITLPNVGRESETFLNYILDKWDSLVRQTIFLQAGIHYLRGFYTYIKNYYNGSTGFLNLSLSGGVCDCENCSDRFS